LKAPVGAFCELEIVSMETVVNIISLPEAAWKKLLDDQSEILKLLKDIKTMSPSAAARVPFITAMEFMQAVRIGRTKFDQLVQANKIKVIKKERKIYVPVGEVERYFGNRT
jgi:hypothetical protein